MANVLSHFFIIQWLKGCPLTFWMRDQKASMGKSLSLCRKIYSTCFSDCHEYFSHTNMLVAFVTIGHDFEPCINRLVEAK